MESIVRCCTKLYICIGQLFKSEKEEEKPLIDESERI